MKSKVFLTAILYLLFSVGGNLYGVGEKTVKWDGSSIAKMADVRTGIAELRLVRPGLVLALSSSGNPSGWQASGSPDMSLSFDEAHPSLFRDSTGNYKLTISPSLAAVERRYARTGYGAALFPGASPIVDEPSGNDSTHRPEKISLSVPLGIEAQRPTALFASNNRMGDFTMEFWMNPLNMENGEQIILWVSNIQQQNTANIHYVFQRIACVSLKNRLEWSFLNFFTSPDGKTGLDIHFTGISPIVPKTWSHHLIRFDSSTGLIEYLVNGNSEAIQYATSSGREGGEVYTPVTGEGGSFVIGSNYMGLLDEFKIFGSYASRPIIRKYAERNGRIETKAIDLGEGNNDILKVEASGGRTSISNTRIQSEYKRNGRFLFSDSSEMQFFIRTSDNPYRWDNPWQPVIPGSEIGGIRGRYVQLAVDFYPSADGEASPYLEELSVTYFPDEPPLPPTGLTAVAMDGAVQLSWRSSPDLKTQGYLVYYGTNSDNYFGEDSMLGSSPVDTGKTNKITITGLKNGTLYYFRVAAYTDRNNFSHTPAFHTGEFSREVCARPLSGH